MVALWLGEPIALAVGLLVILDDTISRTHGGQAEKENDSGAGLMTEKEKIGSKSRNLEQVRRMSVDKRPK